MERKILLIGLALAFTYFILAVSTLPGTGIVWDETRHISGAKARAYSIYAWTTGSPGLEICSLDDVQQNTDNWGRCWDGRPRLSQTLSGLTWAGIWFASGRSLDVMSSVAAHRISTIILTMIGIFVLFLFVTEAFGFSAGIFSSLALIFMPRFFAHSHYVTLNVPVAVMVLLTIYFFWKGLKSWKFGLLTGIVFGLALATKVNAYFIPFVIAIWLLVSYRDKVLGILAGIKNRTIKAKPIPLVFFSFILLSPITLILAWPWLWVNSLQRFITYMLPNIANVKFYGSSVYYMGSIYQSSPWHYPWVIAAITLTLPILIFSIIGGMKCVKDTIFYKNRVSFLILLGALIPMLVFSLPIASLHGGIQLFMPVFPFIAILAGIGAKWFFDCSKKHIAKKNITKLTAIILGLLLIIPGFYAIVRGNSYSANYYNEIVGGPSGAFDLGFEAEYNGEVYLDMVPWLNRNMEENASLYIPLAWNIFNTYKYGDIGQIAERVGEGKQGLNRSIFGQLGYEIFEQKTILRRDLNIVNSSDSADYFILMLRRSSIVEDSEAGKYMKECEPIYTETIGGAPAAAVYKTGCV